MQVDWVPGPTEIVPNWAPHLLRPAPHLLRPALPITIQFIISQYSPKRFRLYRCTLQLICLLSLLSTFLLPLLIFLSLFQETYNYIVPFVIFGAMMISVGFVGLVLPETVGKPLPNILPCKHRTLPLHDSSRLINAWSAT